MREELHAASLSGEIEGLLGGKLLKAWDDFYISVGTVHKYIGKIAGDDIIEKSANDNDDWRSH